jgi:hypothetical protein
VSTTTSSSPTSSGFNVRIDTASAGASSPTRAGSSACGRTRRPIAVTGVGIVRIRIGVVVVVVVVVVGIIAVVLIGFVFVFVFVCFAILVVIIIGIFGRRI